jgi:DNA repair exonuclease SbcCD ATPase subunit
MNRLAITEVEFKNFLSYGNYNTVVNLDNLGPVLIVGDSSENGTKDYSRSNGAGKSTITTAIIWCLFGKTFSLANPGDKVVNWHNGKDCSVRIKTKDGWEIKRTRKSSDNELIVSYNGEDKTLSTLTNTQKFLDKYFGLDFDIFTSSMFFGQFSKPLLELSDQKRKAALERLLNLDKLNIWAKVAKDKMSKAEIGQASCKTKLSGFEERLAQITSQIQSIEKLQREYEENKAEKISLLQEEKVQKLKDSAIEIPDIEQLKSRWDAIRKITQRLNQYENKTKALHEEIAKHKRLIKVGKESISQYATKLSQMKEYNIAKLRDQHVDYAAIEEKKRAIEEELKSKDRTLMEHQVSLEAKKKSISEWNTKSSKQCPTCKQQISKEHVADMCKPIEIESDALEQAISGIESEVARLQKTIELAPIMAPPMSVEEAEKYNSSIFLMAEERAKAEEAIHESEKSVENMKDEIDAIARLVDRVNKQADLATPTMTVDEALELKSQKEAIDKDIQLIDQRIQEISSETNPHIETVQMAKEHLIEVEKKIDDAIRAQNRLDVLFTHISYIKSAYSDRNKIKGFILTSLIPILNRRVQYYLESFRCDFAMEFTPTLSILPSKWDYSLCSGGERKRIDMAIMFALYDLYIHMYGQRCNVMVLDEIDGRLDSEGIESFISIIHNDFASNSDTRSKPDTILIISHRPEMLDAFPSKMLVRKKEGLSFIESII